jgi:hypothetical protein
VKNPFRRIQRIADWLDDRTARQQDRKLRQHYAPKVAEAEKAKDWNRRNELLGEWHFESDTVLDPVYARKAERLTAKARKYGITVPPRPTNYDQQSDDWTLSNASGDWLLTKKTEQQLRRDIKIESRASYDEFRKWATLFFAVVGSALAFLSVLSKQKQPEQKQPDPCSRNYYRSDAGDCVFALPQKDAARQIQPNPPPVQAAPKPP